MNWPWVRSGLVQRGEGRAICDVARETLCTVPPLSRNRKKRLNNVAVWPSEREMKRLALLLSLVVAALVFAPSNAQAKDKCHKHHHHHHSDRNCYYGSRYSYGYRPYYRSYSYYRPTYYRPAYYAPAYYSPYRSYGYSGYRPYYRPGLRISFGF
jgi:hypothetical protein